MALSGLSLDGPATFAAGMRLGEALLEPTRIYVKPVLAALKATDGIKALAHVTGGGLPDNLPRVLPEGMGARIDLGRILVPPVFGWLARAGGVEEAELLRTFNCGVGMVAVVAAEAVEGVLSALRAEGLGPAAIGEVVFHGDGPRLQTTGALRF